MSYSGEAYKPQALVPLKSPIELKDATVRDYTASYRHLGMDVNSAEIERLALADLNYVDAYRRGTLPATAKPKAKKRDAAKKEVSVPDIESAIQLKLRKRRAAPSGWLNMPGQAMDDRWRHMMGRLRRITDGASMSPNMLASISTTECPDLSLRLRRLVSSYMLRHRISKHNPFTTATGGILGDEDAFRKFRRLLENICDDSSGRMGPWWVPK